MRQDNEMGRAAGFGAASGNPPAPLPNARLGEATLTGAGFMRKLSVDQQTEILAEITSLQDGIRNMTEEQLQASARKLLSAAQGSRMEDTLLTILSSMLDAPPDEVKKLLTEK
jgi:hypothetical protein